MTTIAFCTVERVTSAGLLIRRFASICREHDIPNNDVAVPLVTSSCRNVKYEKSSVELILPSVMSLPFVQDVADLRMGAI